MTGSEKIDERLYLLKICEKIIFNSEWSKTRFTEDLTNFYSNNAQQIKIPLNQ